MNEGCSVYFLAKFDMLGNIFGANLNRKDYIEYNIDLSASIKTTVIKLELSKPSL